ncbi:MAG: hypothetical protein HC915_17525, partial [Anaerolineae bacterium]|nr:hypothetical protein [Anaerolineae bacterium]
ALPVQLSMDVPVQSEIPISLLVDVRIPLQETELHQPFVNLRDLLEPFVRSLDNLPQDWEQVPDFSVDAAQGDVDLLGETEGSRNPWDPVLEGVRPASEDAPGSPEVQQPEATEPVILEAAPQEGAPGTGGAVQEQPASPPSATPTLLPLPPRTRT